jgi:hypothetical protein
MARRALARLALVAVALIGAALLGPVRPADAQTLQRLTVQSFTLTADTSQPRVDEPFHIVVTLHVLEHVTEVDNLELPMLAQLELLGDERQIVSGPRDTQYREVVTVVAHAAGTIPIAPATLQAVDARDSKAKQWFTNPLVLRAGVGAGQIFRDGGSALISGAIILFRIVLILVVVGCIVLVGIVLVRRANRVPLPEPQREPPPEPPAPRTVEQQFDDAFVVLRAERTRQAAVRVRSAVWQMFGAPSGATLADVLSRPATTDPRVRNILVALERAAFTYDADLQAAIADACDALERV